MGGPGRVEARRRLWREPDYRRYFVSRLLSVFGSQVTYAATPLLCLVIYGSPVLAGVTAACGYGGSLVFGVVGAPIGDRWSRRSVMAVADAGRGALLLAFAAALVAGARPPGVLLCGLVAVVALLSAAFNSAAAAVLPDIVGPAGFPTASAANQARDFTLSLVGPVVGSMLLTVHPGLPFLLDGLSYLGSLVLVRRLAVVGAQAAKAAGRYTAMLAEGFQALRSDRPGLGLAVLTSLLNLGLGATVYVVLGRAVAGGGGRWAGLILAVQAVGGLAGSLAAAPVYRQNSPTVIATAHGLVWAAAIAVVAVDPGLVVSAMLLAVMWCTAPAARTVLSGHVVARHGSQLRARIFALITVIAAVTSAPGPLAAGFALEAGHATALLAAIAAVVLGSLAVGVWWPARHGRCLQTYREEAE